MRYLLKRLLTVIALWVNQPDITGDNPPSGNKTGVPGGTTITGGAGGLPVPGGLTTVPGSPAAQLQPTSPLKLLQQIWRPGSFMNLHQTLVNPRTGPQASQAIDQAFTIAFQNMGNLQLQQASTQQGSASVTGSQKAIPTGLASVKQCNGVIDNGSTAHNFWLTVTPSATPGAIDIFVWKPTAAGNNTPIAATTAVTVRWYASGSVT